MTGTGTALDPYVLSTEDDLLLIKNNLTAYYELANDIDLASWKTSPGWLPVAGSFTGIFDGKGHSITSLYINRPSESSVGFFSNMDGTLKNIKFVDARVVGNQYVGIAAGTHDAATTAIFDNIKVSGIVSINSNYGGGMIGSLSSDPYQITNCTSKVVILIGNNSSFMGGLIGGGTNTGATTFVDNCTFEGNLGYEDMHYYFDYVGGIAGQLYSAITNCTSKGNIYGDQYIGGIVGGANGGGTAHDISKNTFIGTIKAQNNYVGGIVGIAVSHRIEKNFVQADILSSNGSLSYVGGIAGSVNGTSTYGVRNNETSGKIQFNSGSQIGGIVGNEASSGCYYEYNINTMLVDVEAGNYIGGIVGYPYAGYVRYNINYGTLRGNSGVGGIIGRNQSSSWIYIYYNVNFGDIFADPSASYNGGICGYCYYSYVRYNLNAQKNGQSTVSTIYQLQGSEGYSYNYYINWSGAEAWKSEDGRGSAILEENCKKQSSYTGYDFNNIFFLIEGEELPVPQNAGVYAAYNFAFTYPTSLLDELTAGDAFRLTYTCDWASSIAYRTRVQFYDGIAWRWLDAKFETAGIDLVIPIDVKETYAPLIRLVFYTRYSYFTKTTNNFHIVESEQAGLVFTDESYSPYNNADGTVIKNIRFKNLFLNSLSEAKKIYIYNKTNVIIQQTTVTVDNTGTTAVAVQMGKTNDANFEGVTNLLLENLLPGEFRELYLKVQTTNDPSAALVPIKLYAEQTVSA